MGSAFLCAALGIVPTVRHVRDREVLTSMVAEVAGSLVAEANAKEKGKTLKGIVADHLNGSGGRAKVEGWVPRWMASPPSAYTARGGVGSVAAHALVGAARASFEAAEGEEIAETPGDEPSQVKEEIEASPLAA